MGKLDNLRKVLALPEVIQNVDLTNKLKDIYTDYLELLNENIELKNKLKESEDISDIKKNAKIYNGYYTLDGVKDADGSDIYFCLNCLYEYRLQIPMTLGIVEHGWMDGLSGETLIPNSYGLSCKKCGTKLVAYKKEKNNG